MSDPDPFAEVRAPLAAWLAAQLSAAVEISDLARPTVGQSNDTVLFTATWTHASQSHANASSCAGRRRPIRSSASPT